MPASPLTVRTVETLLPSHVRREVPDGLLPGLYLVIQPTGAKSWAARFRIEGRSQKLTLGRYPRLSLAAAREAARDALRQVAEGRDPRPAPINASAAAAASERLMFADLVDSFLERHVQARNRPSTAKETERLLRRNVCPALGDREASTITRRDVISLLDGQVDGGAAVAANRTLAALSKLFNWAVDRGALESSPCTRLPKPGVERSRDRVLSDVELACVLQAAAELGWPFGTFVQLLALTGQRRNEVAGMRWSEIDTASSTWTIPAARTKNGRVHDVPLAPQVVAILDRVPNIESDLVLTTNMNSPISGFSKAKLELDRLINAGRAEPIAAWTYHDLRRTMASGMARLGIALPVIEKVLNHVSGSFAGVVGVYQRHDYATEKRAALDAWSAALMGLKSTK
jgi:integrase